MLMRQMLTALRAASLRPLLQHLVWGSMSRSRTVVEVAIAGIVRDDFDAIKPYFRALEGVLCLRDSIWRQRIALAWPLLCEGMRAQSRFQKATEVAAERLGLRSP